MNALAVRLSLFLLMPLLAGAQNVDKYYKTIQKEGQLPIPFVLQKLQQNDLILFDDALHMALEPFEFYQDLLATKGNPIDYVFLEVFGINMQSHLDAFMDNEKKDKTILLKVFQDNFGGYGWRYETYYELLSTIWDLNQNLAEDKKIKVIGVDQPIYWEGIHTREEYNTFQESLIGRDYFMYKVILKQMENFQKGKKGIFLTNTRHAYKQIKKKDGSLFWNSGTFFHQWHSGKTYSIRFHNVNLSIEKPSQKQKNASTDGLDKYVYKWVRMENGLWDEAFKMNGDKPVALSLEKNIFGKAPYIGNHMLQAEPGQVLSDAYDAVIFLAPLEELHFSGKIDFIFTPDFKKELKRRIAILEGHNLQGFLKKNDVSDIDEFIEAICQYQPPSKNSLAKE